MIIKIQDSGSHDFDKISSLCFCLQNSLMEFSHSIKTLSHNSAIISFLMYGKYRCPVINSILRCQLLCPPGNSQSIPSVTHKSNTTLLISFQMFSYDLIVRSIFMHINCMAVIHAIHNDMRMTFSKHFPFLFLFPATFLTQTIESDG